jgi:hypothetical protein
MVDKNLETDREVTLEYEAVDDSNFEIAKHENVLIDLIEQKRAADMSEKVRRWKVGNEKLTNQMFIQICPMCGKFYTQDILFEEFQEHVESHFRDDTSDIQRSLENFELVSHTVGNF